MEKRHKQKTGGVGGTNEQSVVASIGHHELLKVLWVVAKGSFQVLLKVK